MAFEEEGDQDGLCEGETLVGCGVIIGRVVLEGNSVVVSGARGGGVRDAIFFEKGEEELICPARTEDEDVDGRGGGSGAEG